MASRKEYELLMKLTASLDPNFNSSFSSAMKTANNLQSTVQNLKKAQGDISAYKKTQDALNATRTKLDDYTKKHDTLQNELVQTVTKERDLQAAVRKAKRNMAAAEDVETYKKLSAEHDALQKELLETSVHKRRLESDIRANTSAAEGATRKIEEQEGKLSALSGELQKAGINTQNLSQENERLEKSFNDLKKAQEGVVRVNAEIKKNNAAISATSKELVKTFGVAGVAAGAVYAGAIKPAVEFESAMAGVKKTIEGTPEELSEIQNGIREMATEIPMGTTQIAAIAEAAGQLGIETGSILGFSRVMADLGVATNLTGEQAAASLAKFANITGMSQGNFDRLGSTIVALGNNLATTEADIVEMSMRLAGAGRQVGLSEAEILSLAGALSSVGIEAEMGGSAISKTLVKMNAAAAGTSGIFEILKAGGHETLRSLELAVSYEPKHITYIAEQFGKN